MRHAVSTRLFTKMPPCAAHLNSRTFMLLAGPTEIVFRPTWRKRQPNSPRFQRNQTPLVLTPSSVM